MTASDTRPMLPATLLDDLAEFVARHRPCGQLTGDATEPAGAGYLPTVGCSCGVVFMRWVTPEVGAREMSDTQQLTGTGTWVV